MNFRAQHHQGEQVIPTARIATSIRTRGASQVDAIRAVVTSYASRPAKGAGARSSALIPSRLAVAITAAALAFLLALSATPAFATTGHGFADSFGGPGPENGQFNDNSGFPPFGIGVGLAGDVFVSDSVRIQSFDATGAFQSVIPVEGFEVIGAVAVDSAPAGGVYLAGYSAGVPLVAKYSAASAFQYDLDASLSETSISFGAAIAADPSNGTVYATATNFNTGAQVIDSFDQSTGAFIASFSGESGSPDGGFACPSSLAVDPTHHIYVLDPCKGRVDKYSAAGAFEATVDDGSRGAVQAVASDPASGEVYVAEAGVSGLQVTNFSAGGSSVLTTFPAANVGSLTALAVGPDGTVYAGDSAHVVVDRFTPFAGPTVTTTAPSEVQRRTATFNGTIDPEGIASEYHYEYGLANTYGSSTAEIDAGSGSSAAEAPGPVTGLVPNTTYHYRLVGSNASGAILGEDQTLTTEAAPPTVDGSPTFVSSITPTGARVHATVDPEHSPTSFRIEYGTSTAYGSIAPEGGAEVGEQSSDQAVATTLTGLQPGTLYHYRVSAENGVEGAQTSADATFITAPAAAASGSEVTARQATLTGTIDPHGAATSYHFNYGPSTAYGVSTPEMNGGSGNGEQTVSQHITGLSPGTTYHVQVIATTNGITSSGADGTFTTEPAPAAKASDPISVTTTSATLQGSADTHGLAGSYHFEVAALEGSFVTSTPEQPLAATTGAQSVSAPVSGLPAGVSLQVRLIVSSNEVTDVSEPAFFATAPLPPGGFPAPPPPGSVYGCSSPKLNPVNGKIKPGSSINVTGSDLGQTGTVLLGEETLLPSSWTAGGFTIEIPSDATGTLGLTINCGIASNTVAVGTTGAPSNLFTVGKPRVKGTTATIPVTLPGPGVLQVAGNHTKATKVTAATARELTVKVTLSPAGLKALRKAKRRTLNAKTQLRFTPTGGQAASRSATLTFKRKAGHR